MADYRAPSPTARLIHAQHLDAESLTLAPIDVGAMDRSLLTAEELVWLNAYHQRVRETITPLADKETAAWLKDVTRRSQVR